MNIYVISTNETIYELNITDEDSILRLNDTLSNIKDRHINTANTSTEYAVDNNRAEVNCLLHYYFDNDSNYRRQKLFDIFMQINSQEYNQDIEDYFYYYSLPDNVNRNQNLGIDDNQENTYLNIQNLTKKINDRISTLQKDNRNIDTNKIRIKSLQKDLQECKKHKNPISIKYLIVTFDNLICIQIKDRSKAIQQKFMGILNNNNSTHFTEAKNTITLKPYFDAIIQLNHEEKLHKISFRQALDFGLFNTKKIIPTIETPEELETFIRGNPYLRDNIIQVDSLVHLNTLNVTARKNFGKLIQLEEHVIEGKLDYARAVHTNNICPDTNKLRLTGNAEQDQNMLKDLIDKMPKEDVICFARNLNR